MSKLCCSQITTTALNMLIKAFNESTQKTITKIKTLFCNDRGKKVKLCSA